MTLTLQEAAQILKISPATVRNWLKAGILKSTQRLHVNETKTKINSGVLQRLQKGANKHQSLKYHTHSELLANNDSAAALRPLLAQFKKQKMELLLAIYLRQLVHAKLITFSQNKFVISSRLKNELSAWNISLKSKSFLSVYKSVAEASVDFSDNLLSYIHQSMNETSNKQDLGAYYTPASVVKTSLEQVKREGTICDPCCGSGNFLLQAYLHAKENKWRSAETSIFGYDCDPLAVLLARANLTLVSDAKIDVVKAVQQKDFLFEQPLKEFSYILTNPPWGSHSEKIKTAKLQKKFRLKKTKDSFSFFILSALQTMKHNGSGHFILPVSFMNVAAHSEFRKYLFSNWTVTHIQLLEEKFSGVMTSAIHMSIQNRRPSQDHNVVIISADSCSVANSEILKASNCAVPLNNDAVSLQVLREIESANLSQNLKGQSVWGLGLVTGNNKEFLFSSAGKNRIPVIKGRQIFRYRQPKPDSYCASDTTQFQQAAPFKVYKTSKKLVYRFIAKELVFAIDNERYFTLNSANILIPQSQQYSCEFLCGLFNSKLGQYYFTKKYASIKVLRSHLENFPLPQFDEKIFSDVEACVRLLQRRYDQIVADQLDHLIVSLYKLSKESQSAVLNYNLNEAFNG